MAITDSAFILAEKLRKAEADVAALRERNGLLTLAVCSVGGRIEIPGEVFSLLPHLAFRCERDLPSGNTVLTTSLNTSAHADSRGAASPQSSETTDSPTTGESS